MNSNFIKLHKEIIQLKSELHKRSVEYLISKEYNVEAKAIDKDRDLDNWRHDYVANYMKEIKDYYTDMLQKAKIVNDGEYRDIVKK